MNFNSIFEELSKLYDEELVPAKKVACPHCAEMVEAPVDIPEDAVINCPTCNEGFSMLDLSEGCNRKLKEEAEDEEIEIVDDEEVAEEEPVEEEPATEAQLVLECANCGALIIRAESDVEADEESGVANVDEACQYCEAQEGYKVIGTFTPYAEELEEGLKQVKKGEPEQFRKITMKELKAGDYVIPPHTSHKNFVEMPSKITKVEPKESGRYVVKAGAMEFHAEGDAPVYVFDAADIKGRKAFAKQYFKSPSDFKYEKDELGRKYVTKKNPTAEGELEEFFDTHAEPLIDLDISADGAEVAVGGATV